MKSRRIRHASLVLSIIYGLILYRTHSEASGLTSLGVFPGFQCGSGWSLSSKKLKGISKSQKNKPFIWTVVGGDEYREYLKVIFQKWVSLGLYPSLIISLDMETNSYLCNELGFASMLWDLPKNSYSSVADAKFEVSATLAESGIHGFFMEVDVFCKESPLPLFLQPKSLGIVSIGHGYADFSPNIGMYYVEPLQQIANYFRSLANVLSYSKNHKSYFTQNGVELEFFDQRLFYQCMPPTNKHDSDYKANQTIHLPLDNHNNLLAICRNVSHAKPFPWSTVSNVYISAHDPPIVFEPSTICIHPLFDSPFSSLRLKIATAKFLGFDPEPLQKTEKFLSTLNGDLTLNECWVHPFVWMEGTWSKDIETHTVILTLLANLIYFSKKSGRTLVLPRYFRDQNAFAVPILSLVDIRSIEKHVPYRYVPSDMKKRVIVANGRQNDFLKRIRSESEQLVSIHRFCEFADVTSQEVASIAKSLKTCFTDTRVKFVRGRGSWSRICGG
jgi:Nucleotide-diphospho-sugar transferase